LDVSHTRNYAARFLQRNIERLIALYQSLLLHCKLIQNPCYWWFCAPYTDLGRHCGCLFWRFNYRLDSLLQESGFLCIPCM